MRERVFIPASPCGAQTADAETTVSEIGLSLTADTGEAPGLLQSALTQGVTYWHARDRASLAAAAAEVREQAVIGVQADAASLAEDCAEALAVAGGAPVDALWAHMTTAGLDALEPALVSLQGFQQAGKTRAYGFSLEGLSDHDQLAAGEWAIQKGVPLLLIAYSLHESQVGRDLFRLAEGSPTRFIVALPQETTGLDLWLGADLAEIVSSLARKTRQLRFLTESGRSLAQAAIKFALAQPSVACVLPSVRTVADLQAAVSAAESPDLSRAELNRIDDLVAHGFHLQPGEMPTVYNG
ncbi:MAG: aldo/keto reductase [Chloroflexi bacterium]|nr:aldo/keto reductase [Chloroflexota bacterium]